MSVRARVIVEGAFAGMHQNPHAGSSIEFAEHKEYAPGDDIRRIDWKAVGRVDRYYIKRFEDETEMRTFLLVDSSASMGYGRKGVTKLAYASYLAAALAYLLAQQGDPAGLMLFDEKTRQYLPPRTRAGHIRDLLVALEAAYPAGRTEPGRALAEIGEIADRRSLIVLFTDLLDAPADLPIACARCVRAATTWCCSTSSIPTRSSCRSTTSPTSRAWSRTTRAGCWSTRAIWRRRSRASRRRCASAGARPAWRRGSSTGSRRRRSRPPRCCARSCSRASGRDGRKARRTCTSSRRRCSSG